MEQKAVTTIKSFSDIEQSRELFVVTLTGLKSPQQVWQGVDNLLSAVQQKMAFFGCAIGELVVQDDRAPDGYARWTLNLSNEPVSFTHLPSNAPVVLAEGRLATRPLIWTSDVVSHLQVQNLRDPHDIYDICVALQAIEFSDWNHLLKEPNTTLNAYRIPQISLSAADDSALNLYLFYDDQAHELSLSIEALLDLWLPQRFDGSDCYAWAKINYQHLHEIIESIAQASQGKLECLEPFCD